MQFEVPQFIEIEDKIIGPLTIRQFIYLAGAGGFAFMIWRIIPSPFSFVLMAPAVVFGIALAFYKFNNRPFVHMLESAFNYYLRGKLFLWIKTEKTVDQQMEEKMPDQVPIYVPKMSDSKLKDIAWSLDVTERERGEVL